MEEDPTPTKTNWLVNILVGIAFIIAIIAITFLIFEQDTATEILCQFILGLIVGLIAFIINYIKKLFSNNTEDEKKTSVQIPHIDPSKSNLFPKEQVRIQKRNAPHR